MAVAQSRNNRPDIAMTPPPAPAPLPTVAPCPCGRGPRYGECCGRWHAAAARSGEAHAADADGATAGPPDPETLMRSRYSAYVLGLADYLLATWHPSTRPPAVDPTPADLRWLGLEVRAARRTGADTAEVEFVARSKLGGRAHRLHETSRFVREDGRWYYVDGNVR
jgi:SEC-C motif-containing protein